MRKADGPRPWTETTGSVEGTGRVVVAILRSVLFPRFWFGLEVGAPKKWRCPSFRNGLPSFRWLDVVGVGAFSGVQLHNQLHYVDVIGALAVKWYCNLYAGVLKANYDAMKHLFLEIFYGE